MQQIYGKTYFFYMILFLGLLPHANAQDFRASGGSRLPPQNSNDQAKQIRVADDRTVPAEEVFVSCGQSCSFAAANEAITALTTYFQMKQSSIAAASRERRQNVFDCTSGNRSRCNQRELRDLLDSALHYNFGRIMRDAYLQNETSRVRLESLERERLQQLNEPLEKGQEKWVKGESTWKETIQRYGVSGSRERNRPRPFAFNLDDKGFQLPDNQEIRELDAQFLDDYRNFFQTYQPQEDRLFARRKEVANSTRTRSRMDQATTSVFEFAEPGASRTPADANAANSGPLLDEELRREAQERMAVAFRGNRRGVEDALQMEFNRNINRNVPSNQPAIFERDKDEVKAQVDTFNRARDRFEEEVRNNGGISPALQGYLTSTIQVPEQAIVSRNYDQIRSQLRSYENGYLQQLRQRQTDPNFSSARQIASDINRQFENLAKLRDQENNVEISIATDVAAFDNFLESMWPTDAGEKLRERYRQEQEQQRLQPRINTN